MDNVTMKALLGQLKGKTVEQQATARGKRGELETYEDDQRYQDVRKAQ